MNGRQRLKPMGVQCNRTKTRDRARENGEKFDDGAQIRGPRVLGFDERFTRGNSSVRSGHSAETDTSRSTTGPLEAMPPAHWGTLLAPGGLSVSYLAIAALFGPGAFEPTGSGLEIAVAFGLLGLLVLVAGFSTARLYTDAAWEATRTTSWSPDPWRYVVGGGAVLVALCLVHMAAFEAGAASLLSLTGAAFVSLPLASTVVGPIYVLQRFRRVEDARAGWPSECIGIGE